MYKKEYINGFYPYQIDTNGIIYSKRNRNKPLQYTKNKHGYYMVVLCMNGIPKTFSVHRLVALQFIKNTDSKRNVVNHIDGNKQNNNVNNLEWVTNQENSRHAVDVLHKNLGVNNYKSKALIGYNIIDNVVKYRFNCIADAARFFATGTNNKVRYIQNNIWKVLNGLRKSYKRNMI